MALDIEHELRRIGRSLEGASSTIAPAEVRRHERGSFDLDDLLHRLEASADDVPLYLASSSRSVRRLTRTLVLCAVAIMLIAAAGLVTARRGRSVSSAPSPAYWLPGWLPADYQITHKESDFAQGVPAIVASNDERGLMVQWLAGSRLTPMAFTEPFTVADRQAFVTDTPTGGLEIEIDHSAGGVLDIQGHGWSEPELRSLAERLGSVFDGDLRTLTRLVPADLRPQLVPAWTAVSYVMFTNNEIGGNVQVEQGRSFAVNRMKATYPHALTSSTDGQHVVDSGSSPGVTVLVEGRTTVTVTGVLSPADRLHIAQSVRAVDRGTWDSTTDRTPSLNLGPQCESGEPPADAARADLAPGSVLAVWTCTPRYAFFRIRDGGGPLVAGSYGLTAFDDLQTSPPSVVVYGLQPANVTRVVVRLASGEVVEGKRLDVADFADPVWFAVVAGQMTDVRGVDSYIGDRLASQRGRPTG